jgi:hypothetical protein
MQRHKDERAPAGWQPAGREGKPGHAATWTRRKPVCSYSSTIGPTVDSRVVEDEVRA